MNPGSQGHVPARPECPVRLTVLTFGCCWSPGLLGEALLGAVHPELCLGPMGPSEYLASPWGREPFPIVLFLVCLPTGVQTLQLAMSGVLVAPAAHPSISRTSQEPSDWWLKIENPNPLGV